MDRLSVLHPTPASVEAAAGFLPPLFVPPPPPGGGEARVLEVLCVCMRTGGPSDCRRADTQEGGEACVSDCRILCTFRDGTEKRPPPVPPLFPLAFSVSFFCDDAGPVPPPGSFPPISPPGHFSFSRPCATAAAESPPSGTDRVTTELPRPAGGLPNATEVPSDCPPACCCWRVRGPRAPSLLLVMVSLSLLLWDIGIWAGRVLREGTPLP
mmetsp:Transcript_46568/g.91952  ORF Transcript_46568/g.91952 Transcript_46568/m.91952 type:complete len:211 (-) Transcript_46568:740-1372(-)